MGVRYEFNVRLETERAPADRHGVESERTGPDDDRPTTGPGSKSSSGRLVMVYEELDIVSNVQVYIKQVMLSKDKACERTVYACRKAERIKLVYWPCIRTGRIDDQTT